MDFSELTRISSGFVQSRILQVAVKLGLFDVIKSEGSLSEEVARVLDTNLGATELFLNALVALKVLDKEEGKFYNTENSINYLVKDSPKYFGGMILFEEGLWDMWGKLEESVRTGKSARPTDMFQNKEQETERFIMAMHSLVKARGDAEILSDKLDFKWAKTMIDIGSGPGTYPMEFLKKHPHLKITIFDLPGTLKITKRVLRKAGMFGKMETVEGNYNTDELPEGFDVAFLSNIIHSESEENNQRLMKKIYKTLNPGGELIIKDHILDDTLTRPAVGAIFSVQMLLATGGRDYSFQEVRSWLENAGFKKPEWIKLDPPLTSSLVVCTK
ncbi:MAG: methyltransferase domain-containing protein [Deltaproteobacteria bacterium]|nr:methyltransferase domain-containing protein [Deltaproteobacteria bacterium]